MPRWPNVPAAAPAPVAVDLPLPAESAWHYDPRRPAAELERLLRLLKQVEGGTGARVE